MKINLYGLAVSRSIDFDVVRHRRTKWGYNFRGAEKANKSRPRRHLTNTPDDKLLVSSAENEVNERSGQQTNNAETHARTEPIRHTCRARRPPSRLRCLDFGQFQTDDSSSLSMD
jgi:hypothetical protein